MITIEQFTEKYSKDAQFRAQVDADVKTLRERGALNVSSLMALGKKYGVRLSLAEVPGYIALAKRHGLI